MSDSTERRPFEQAVIAGGGMAGLLAARALAARFRRVVIVERDDGPSEDRPRKGVPQGRHAHALLVRGLAVLEEMFPGFAAAAVARGAVPANAARDVSWGLGGTRLAPATDDLPVIVSTRPLLEAEVRHRVMAIDHCHVMGGYRVNDIILSPDRRRVTGVALHSSDGERLPPLQADLVVDATGRASRLPAWLENSGFAPPPEETLDVGVGYSTVQYRVAAQRLGDRRAVIVGATPHCPRGGVAHLVEGGRLEVSLAGYRDHHPPTNLDGLVAFAKSLALPDLYDLIVDAEPLSDVAIHRVPRTWRRRFDKLRDFPAGLVALGDAICAFNPIFAQGMSIAAIEARTLAALLDRLTADAARATPATIPPSLAPTFFRAIARDVAPAWTMARGNDLLAPHLAHGNSLAGRLLSRWIARVLRAGAGDAEIARRFIRVASLVDSPATLLAPGTIDRVAFPRRAGAKRRGQPEALRTA